MAKSKPEIDDTMTPRWEKSPPKPVLGDVAAIFRWSINLLIVALLGISILNCYLLWQDPKNYGTLAILAVSIFVIVMLAVSRRWIRNARDEIRRQGPEVLLHIEGALRTAPKDRQAAWEHIKAIGKAIGPEILVLIAIPSLVAALVAVAANVLLAAQLSVMIAQTARMGSQNALLATQNEFIALQRLSEVQEQAAQRKYDRIVSVLTDSGSSFGMQIDVLRELPEAMVMPVYVFASDKKTGFPIEDLNDPSGYKKTTVYPNHRGLKETLITYMREDRVQWALRDRELVTEALDGGKRADEMLDKAYEKLEPVSNAIRDALFLLGPGTNRPEAESVVAPCVWTWKNDGAAAGRGEVMPELATWPEEGLRDYLDFRHLKDDLTNAVLPGVYLGGAHFAVRTNFARAQMQRACMNEAQLPEAIFDDAQLQGAQLSRTQIRGVNFSGTQLQGADLSRAHMQGTAFRNTRLFAANFSGAHLQLADFSGEQLQGAYFGDAELQGAKFMHTQLQGSIFAGAQLQGGKLESARLHGASLIGAQLQGADLSGAQLHGASLADSNLAMTESLFIREEEFDLVWWRIPFSCKYGSKEVLDFLGEQIPEYADTNLSANANNTRLLSSNKEISLKIPPAMLFNCGIGSVYLYELKDPNSHLLDPIRKQWKLNSDDLKRLKWETEAEALTCLRPILGDDIAVEVIKQQATSPTRFVDENGNKAADLSGVYLFKEDLERFRSDQNSSIPPIIDLLKNANLDQASINQRMEWDFPLEELNESRVDLTPEN